MNIEQMNCGKELLELIKVTENGLRILKGIELRDSPDKAMYKDRLYSLHISEWRDGPGGAYLARYCGNERLLNVIITELEKQLTEFQEAFEAL
jgi:hypothetical protein